MEIKLGQQARCKLTGYTGTVVCISKWLNGCTTIGVKAKELKDGKPIDTQFFDEPQVEIVPEEAVPIGGSKGGPERPCPSTMRQ
jgi:hypothetical protein